MYHDKLAHLYKKRVLILGYGHEGVSTHRFLRKYFPKKKIFIADRRKISTDDLRAEVVSGKKYLDCLTKFDVVFKTPGIPHNIREIVRASKSGVKFTSQTKLFMDLCEGVVIGVTGTKGKSTTASLIGKILQDAGYRVVVVGNIDKPCLDYLGDDWGKGKYFAFELSSHQLSDLTKSPHIAVFLNIFKEHLDYYGSFAEYFQAKTNITKFQNKRDIFIYDADFRQPSKLAKNTKASTRCFSLKEDTCNCFYRGRAIYLKHNNKNIRVVNDSEINLLGKHNLNNVMAACLIAAELGIPLSSLQKSLRVFKPLEDRLEFIGRYQGIDFYSDALATIPEATMAAIEAFKGRLGGLIVGGLCRKGVDFSALAKKILKENLDIVVLFPETGNKIYEEMQRASSNIPLCRFVGNMSGAVKLCYKHVAKGKICLLSNASPSFNLFKNYKDKSEQFKLYVEKFG